MKRLVSAALCFFSFAAAAQTGAGGTSIADCPMEVPLVMITDDPYNTPSDLAEKWRAAGLQTPYAQVRRQAAQTRCARIADPDPLLLALPGTPLPDLIVRVKPLRAELYDKTVGDKIDAGIRGYIESYTSWLGAKSTTEGPPLLREVALGVTVMCTRERRVTRELTTIDDEATQPLVQNGENTAQAQNAARLERAARRLAGEIEALARNVGKLCGAPPAPVAPLSQPGLPSLRIDTPAAPVAADPAAPAAVPETLPQ